MAAVLIAVHLVNGGLQEIQAGPEVLDKLRMLQAEDLAGKRLIDRLVTDDWGVPPAFVDVRGTDGNGRSVNVRIPYR